MNWKMQAVAWLRGKASEQAQNNERWPEHAKCYPSWTERVEQMQHLANELEREARDEAGHQADEATRLRALLRRGMRQLEAWQEKYGEWQPQWLPPAGDVRWAEDVEDALKTPNDLGNRRDAGPIGGASVLTDGLCGNGSEVGAGDTAKKGKQ